MRLPRLLGCLLIVSALAVPVEARGPTLSSMGSTIQLTATLDESLSLVAEMESVNFPLRPLAMAQPDHSLIIQTRWNLDESRACVVVSAYFSGSVQSAARAPAGSFSGSDVYVRVASGSASAFTSLSGTGDGRSVELLRQGLIAGVNDRASRSDALELKIDLTRMSRLPADDDYGVLTLAATAY